MRRPTSFSVVGALSGVCGLLLLLAGCTGNSSPGATGTPSSPAGLPTPTPTLNVGPTATIASAKQRLAAENPEWTTFINAVESADVPTVLTFFNWQDHPCTPASYHAGDSPICSDLGVPDGTKLKMFPVTDVPLPTGVVDPTQITADTGWHTRSQVAAAFDTLLRGRHPSLGLVAAAGDGRLYLTFTLNRQLDSTGFMVAGISFQVQSTAAPLMNIYSEVGTQATPLGAISEAEQRGGQEFDIWGLSPELQSEEAAIQPARHQP